MDIIWAPWRMKYIIGEKEKGCLFCRVAKVKKDRKNYLLFRGQKCFILLNTFPYNNGHLMIAPYRHLANLKDLNKEELNELMELAGRSVGWLKKSLAPEGFNIGMNIGKIAGAGIENHLHIHIVPRWSGDSNFMPTIAQIKVIPELLKDTYKKLLRVVS
ncbi:MAG: HIT domain-containing protein [Firmicutes bacterium]|nr:HIT domain-containing protein [Bacillota bacterium]